MGCESVENNPPFEETPMPLGIRPIVDFAFKKTFGSVENAPILIGLLNAILRLVRPIVHVEILNHGRVDEV